MTIPDSVRQRVAERDQYRCSYCQMPARYVYGTMEIDHIIPRSRGGTDDEGNLCLCCGRCNKFKGNQIDAVDPLTAEVVALFNPRTQQWSEHFEWHGDDYSQIVGKTSCGRVSVEAIRLNFSESVEFRRLLKSVG
ncbi:MAG: HNH endonuclease [Phototrophicales bacterium]|nr:MAG: HNH endonuclease [Phototrophicales bacterium]